MNERKLAVVLFTIGIIFAFCATYVNIPSIGGIGMGLGIGLCLGTCFNSVLAWKEKGKENPESNEINETL